MAITMTELATRLNLSQSTVSLVLNNRDKGRVRPELAERIRQEAAATGFRLNRAASDLRRRHSNTIGVALAYSGNLYRTELVSALHAEIIHHGYRPLFAFFSNNMEQQSATRLLLDNNLDAIITLEPQWLPDHLDLPVVSLFHSDPRFDAVIQDAEAGLRMSLECLWKLGHRRIGWYGYDESDSRSRLLPRLASEYGMELPKVFHVCSGKIYELAGNPSFFEPLRHASHAELPTALLCHNDTIAIMLMRRLHECGLRIPEDLSLIGHDDVSLCSQLVPTLSSVGYGSRESLAKRLVGRVLKRLEHPELPRCVELLPPHLFRRESIAVPKHENKS
ncbi:MAG: LacI family DNA-binding transcriptional regulator [Victivallales bacterium]